MSALTGETVTTSLTGSPKSANAVHSLGRAKARVAFMPPSGIRCDSVAERVKGVYTSDRFAVNGWFVVDAWKMCDVAQVNDKINTKIWQTFNN